MVLIYNISKGCNPIGLAKIIPRVARYWKGKKLKKKNQSRQKSILLLRSEQEFFGFLCEKKTS